MNGRMAKRIRKSAQATREGREYQIQELVYQAPGINKATGEVGLANFTMEYKRNAGQWGLYKFLKGEYKRWRKRKVYKVAPRMAQEAFDKAERRRKISQEKAYQKKIAGAEAADAYLAEERTRLLDTK